MRNDQEAHKQAPACLHLHNTSHNGKQSTLLINYGEAFGLPFFMEAQMRIRITRRGIYRSSGDMVAVGTELEVPDDFAGWANKWVRVDSPKATLEVASPAPAEEPEADADLDGLRAEYESVFGEKPHHKMKASTIRRKLAETEAD